MFYGSGSRKDFFGLHFQSIGAIWFLLALFWSVLFLTAVLNMSDRLKLNEGKKDAFVVGVFSAKLTWFPFSVQAGAAGTLFLMVGYLYHEHKECVGISSCKTATLFLGAVWLIAIYRSFTNDNLSIVRCYFPDLLLNVFGATGGNVVIIKLSKAIDGQQTRIKKMLLFWGKNSLVMLCIHNLERSYIPYERLLRMFEGKSLYFVFMFMMELAFISFEMLLLKKALSFITNRGTLN